MAAGVFVSIEEAQEKMCLPHKTFVPETQASRVYDALYALYRKLYFAMGSEDAAAGRDRRRAPYAAQNFR